MSALADIIRARIEAEGPLTLAAYMQLALQHPRYGYYVSGDPLGPDGDFVTAPEISQMFGEMIGLWLAELWRLMGKPSRFALLEMGPGRGTLMRDALRATAKVEGFHQAARLYLMESNESFRERQAQGLSMYAPRFIEDPAQLPLLPLLAVANEFFDALPIHQYIQTESGWRERLVGWDGTRFAFAESPHPVSLPLPQEGEGGFYEISPASLALMQDVASAVSRRGGGALIVDYGYTQRAGENTLQAVQGHAFADPLEKPGEVDLTAHVDFAALRLVSEGEGAKVFPVMTQGAFLSAMGIDLRAALLKRKATPSQAAAIDSALQRLTDSSQMGALFKAMAVTRPDIAEVPGFP